jgi:hypothetical protein
LKVNSEASLTVELDMRYVAFFIWIDMARAINGSEKLDSSNEKVESLLRSKEEK